SRDSMRSIPSPKPAPSTTLPDVPRQPPSPPPRLPSIAVNPSLGLSLDRASQSAPALLVSPKRDSTSSVVSPTIRKINRSHALARLEGRTNSTRRRSRPIKRNFMSMSDEESEADDDDDDDSPTLPLIDEPEDLVLPSPPLSLSEPRTVPLGPRFPSSPRMTLPNSAGEVLSRSPGSPNLLHLAFAFRIRRLTARPQLHSAALAIAAPAFSAASAPHSAPTPLLLYFISHVYLSIYRTPLCTTTIIVFTIIHSAQPSL
ncbi:hypothetical protein J132_02220, partial [Termitomyces sp. J132]